MSAIKEKGHTCVFGEVLYDRFPDGSEVLGGAPFNVSWHLQAFGSHPLFISRVGDDALGEQIRMQMQNWKMDTAGLQTDTSHATGTVDITLRDNEPSFDIVANCAYDHIVAEEIPERHASMIYHGSLALRADNNREALRFLKLQNDAPVFMDVNLRDPWWSRDDVNHLIKHARWVKLNEHELELLARSFGDEKQRARRLVEENDLALLVVTLGERGAFAIERDGSLHQVEPTETKEVVDTVGAGDAFASVFMLGLQNNWAVNDMLERAQAFASAVVGIRGATTFNPDFYLSYLRHWYKDEQDNEEE